MLCDVRTLCSSFLSIKYSDLSFKKNKIKNLKHDIFFPHFIVENVFDNNATFVSFDNELISRRHFIRLF